MGIPDARAMLRVLGARDPQALREGPGMVAAVPVLLHREGFGLTLRRALVLGHIAGALRDSDGEFAGAGRGVEVEDDLRRLVCGLL